MRAVIVILGILLSALEFLFVAPSNDIGFAVGTFGLLASLALIVSRRAGFAGLVITAAFSLMAVFWVEAVVFGGLAFLTWRLIRQHRINEERAERMDRYVRSQLGE